MGTSNMAAVSRASMSISGPTDGDVPIRKTLLIVAALVGTTAFYDLFTRRTGISVDELGRVVDLEQLECPHWFLRKLYYEVGAFYRDHSDGLLRQFGERDTSLSLALTATCARSIAERLAQKHGTQLVNEAFAQLPPADGPDDLQAAS
jgi:hypothetical protein